VVFAEDDAGAAAMAGEGGVSHALTLAETAAPLAGLPPIPHAIGVAANSRNLDQARQLLDWLTSDAAGALLRLSPWQAATNGLQTLLIAAPPLDVEWARQQYAAARRRWAQSGFAPVLES
jgi:ABC-type Fe3+ transport system substrate-binding protein